MLKSNKKIWFSVSLAFLLSVSFAMPTFASNASLYLSPSSETYTVDNIFSVKVKINSGTETINAAEGKLIFNSNEISVVNISKNSSIFNLWTTEPIFSNALGTIEFGGGVPSGYQGVSGTIVTINFRAKTVGNVNVNFFSGSILAADGKGTDVLNTMNSGSYTILSEKYTPPVEEYISPKKAPTAPVIFSSTHSNSEKWYSNNNPKFTWKVSEDITGVKLLIGKNSKAIPGVFYSELITEKQLEDLADGVWYFHVQLRNKFGWGAVSHFKFQIDIEPPKPFEIIVKQGKETTNPQSTLVFETNDDTSGIDYYEIIVNQESPIKVEETEYDLFLQDLGKHTIIVKAIDKAKNNVLAMTEINVLPIEAPIITDYPKELLPGNIFSVKGTALPEAVIKVYIQKDGKEIKIGETKSDKEGKWVYIEVEPLEKGAYQVWAEVIDSLGAKSKPSEKVTILVSPPVFIKIGRLVIDYLTMIITLLVLILAIISGAIWSWKKIRQRRKILRKEISEAERASFRAFKALREETKEQVAKLDGKPGLSRREKKICDDLKKALNISEKFIGKEIKDIEKELE